MKTRHLLLLLLSIFYVGMHHAQTRGINYKALISNNTGAPLANQNVTVQFTILEGNMMTTEVYKESHTTTTDDNGIIIVNIGEGNIISGNFTSISWGLDTHFIKTEIDTGSGFVDFGTTEFKTVPYALYAESAGVSSPFSESAPNRITAANTNANFVVGSVSTEDQNSINFDSRMFYDKSKVAFRAGSVDGTQWDNANRGLYSFAGGRNNTADGISTTVFGENNQASGYGATVLGRQNTANGSNSLVAGFGNISSNQINAQTVLGKWNEEETDALLIIGNGADNMTRKNILSVKADGNIIASDLSLAEITQSNALVTKAYVDANVGTPSTGLEQLDEGNGNGWRLIGQNANNFGNIGNNAVDLSTTTFPNTTYGATGNSSFASGIVTTASGFGATAMGNGSSASGENAFAAGGASTASGEGSSALGKNTVASGNFSFAVGEDSEASGNHSFVFGSQTSAIGLYSFAGGLSSSTSDQYSFAMGNNARATKSFAFAFGRLSDANGQYSASFGENVEVNANYGFVAGSSNTVDGNHSVVFGQANTASNPYSAVFGLGNTVNAQGAMATGLYNTYDPNAIFQVGNGTSGSTSTAFKVLNSGVVNINNLAGTGTRNVKVDASGNLIANTTANTEILVVSAFDFVKGNEENGIGLTRDVFFGSFINVPGDIAEIYAPIQLPKGAIIEKVEYVYSESDGQANRFLEFSIGYHQINSTTNAHGNFTISNTALNTNSFPPSNKIATANNVNFQVSPSTNIWRAFFVRVKPGTGGWTGNGLMAIQQVRIHYTH
ncbi:trimeric autotransporter adhesin [Kordia periserrulae]|uniref:Trimeric autotransporter adhesin n=1 Tax=Kordia periserrulae TaxID=701523 RepID=A0A2T6C1K4_9FLAO|nr:hypothetical protein [Kordia periserrulae]PTX62203.1 trimeric autotransporter adhesin [Kordia periserrulae]